MGVLKEMIAYVLKHYPYKSELSNARVTKIIYLADWYSCINSDRQISDIRWVYDNYGPFVWDVKKVVEENDELFSIQKTVNMYGSDKLLISLCDKDYSPSLDSEKCKILDRIIEVTKGLNWSSFINVVYSTYPIASSDRYSSLDLVLKARQYKKSCEG